MEKLSCPEKETCVIPPHYVMETECWSFGLGKIFAATWNEICVTPPSQHYGKVEHPEKETCVTPPPHTGFFPDILACNWLESQSGFLLLNSTRDTMLGAFSFCIVSPCVWRQCLLSCLYCTKFRK